MKKIGGENGMWIIVAQNRPLLWILLLVLITRFASVYSMVQCENEINVPGNLH